ncbi:MAG: ATP-binding protein [Phycisphaerales bacterium]|jgi:two-component system phosphate regulon sensor histidine kinase PhoR
MPRKRLLWQLYPSYLAITLIALVAVSWYFSESLYNFYIAQLADGLESRAYLTTEQISEALDVNDLIQVDKICKTLGTASSTRITVVILSGKVLGDSEKEPANMENHANRPEIRDVLEFGKARGQSVRTSPTLGINMMYVAVPLKQNNRVVGVVRASIPVTAINQALDDIYIKIFWGGLIIAICAAAVCLFISRRITRPIIQMQQTAQNFAEGKLEQRVPVPDSYELGTLAGALNQMAQQLDERIKTITQQRNELEAILSSMVEGVLAVDSEEHIVSINKSAAEFLDIEPDQARGRYVEEMVRNISVQQFIKKAIKGEQSTEADVSLPIKGERYFRLYGSTLLDNRGNKAGAVIVLNDMTRMRRLENIRRDFVANVSHELRTPITSIQGFVEALLDGAIDEPKNAKRYLEIIAKHSDRLNAIIEDLLSLSHLEEDSEKRQVTLEKVSLKPVFAAAIELSGVKAQEKQAMVNLTCEDDIQLRINPALLEQAILNLIDNAIKYSPPGETIQVNVEKDDKELSISVQDNGCGIDKKHLSRIFERFYVVDKGRSRKLGGTGLGLAIVKHIAQIHSGYVTVKSTPGKGSTFTIHLPAV